MADLSVEFAGVKFKNPVLAASAEPTLDLKLMRKIIEAGAGGLVAKSMSSAEGMRKLSNYSSWRYLTEKHEPARGKVPRLFTFYGRAGATLVPPREWIKVLKEVKRIADAEGAVLIASGMGPSIEEWVEQAKMVEDIGIEMMELNFGCPHPYSMKLGAKTGMEIGQDIEFSSEIVKAITSAVSLYDWEDVTEFMMSGATTVQLCSVLMLKGIGYLKEVITGLNEFLDRKGYKSVNNIIGTAAKSALLYDEIYELGRSRATIDEEKCTMCGNCLESCFYGAIDTDGEKVWVNENCVGCGICFSICPSDAVELSAPVPFE